MKNHSVESRINRLRKQIEGYANSSEHKFTLELVSTQTIERLRSLEYFPLDMLMILEQIGCMRNWGRLGHQMIDWWAPCTIEQAIAEDRCWYELSDSNFTNLTRYLFFAWDCDANCYFYDITATPWKVVVCDGLSMEDEYSVIPWPYEGSETNDALSVIENWAFY